MAHKTLLSDLEAYRTLLDVYSSEQIDQKISNDFFEHSSSVYERFFLDCHEDITILARGVKDQIFNVSRVKESAREFISRKDTKLNFYLRAKDDSDIEKVKENEFIIYLHKALVTTGLDGQGKLNISFYEGDDMWLNDTPSVTVGDDHMYRRRYSKEASDIKITGKAIVNFGDKASVNDIRTSIAAKIESLTSLATLNF